MRAIPIGLLLLCSSAPALAANVRTDRPRMFLSNGTGRGTSLASFKARCTTDASYQKRCGQSLAAGGGLYPAINDAAGYLVNADAARCTKAYATLQTVAADAPGQPDAHSFISNNGRTMVQLAVVRDWCDPVLDSTQKTWIETKITAIADWMTGGMGGYALDVWHDDMNNVWSSVALAGLSLKGTAQDAKATLYLNAADAQWKKVIFPALAYENDFWHEGMTYVQPTVGGVAWYADAWSIATDEDVFAWAKTNANDVLAGYLRMHAYLMRPDYTFAYFGDTSDNKQSAQLFTRPLIDILTQGTGSTLGQALSIELRDNLPAYYDYSGADFYLAALFYDASKDGAATPRTTLPTSGWMSKGAADVAVMRSGWGKNDTFVYVSCGDYFGSHQHIEAGSFQIWKGTELTGSSGYYDNFGTDHWDNYYSQQSVHANTIAVRQPGEIFPNETSATGVNGGGQRPLRRDKNGSSFPTPDLPTYLKYKTAAPYVDTADIKTFELAKCHSYVACDATAAYSSAQSPMNGNTAKVSEVARQFVYLPPDLVVVFDRVEATDPTYEKRFLLETPDNPQVLGLDYTAGKLFAKTLLPAAATANTLVNFTVDGKPHPPTTTGVESFGTRIEVVAKPGQKRDYFLHVLATSAAAPTSTVTEDALGATLSIDSAQGKYTLSFLKTGALGGHLVAKDVTGATTLCDYDLGASAQNPDGGTTPPGGDAAMPAGDAGGPFDDGASSGCGCRMEGTGPVSGLSLLFGAAFLSIFRARRRR